MRDRLKSGQAISPLKGPPVDDQAVKKQIEAQDALAKAFAKLRPPPLKKSGKR